MPKKKKVLITAGGTGGHLFPAQILAQELKQAGKEILFVGGGLHKNRYFDRHFSFEEIPCATFSLKNPIKILLGTIEIAKGFLKSRKIIKRFEPDLVVGFGSFYTLPVLLAALSYKIPFFLHEQNAIPGKVNKLLASYSKGVALTFPEASSHLKGNSFITELPVKKSSLGDGHSYFSLDPGKLTLLIFGGSQGAKKINALFLEAATQLKTELKDYQVIHITGDTLESQKAKETYTKLNIKSYVVEFEKHLDLAWKISHLAVQRAGASSICESIKYEKPGLLIPYASATDDHQTKNGYHFINVVKGGEMISEKEATPKIIADHILNMLKNQDKIRTRIQAYKDENPRSSLTEILLKHL